MQVATWNVNSLRVRLPQVLEWMQQAAPAVLALQETKLPDEQFPVDAFDELGYRALYTGQKTYNGVALVAREPLEEPLTSLPGIDDEARRFVAATVGDLRVVGLYVPNGQRLDSDKFDYKLDWLAALRTYLEAELRRYPRLVVVGDFNIAPEDRDVHDPEAWRGSVLCSPAERQALAAILGLGLSDTFRLFEQEPDSYSWWDYRAGAFRRNRGLRIDLILASAAAAASCRFCRVDRGPRRWPRPADHAPVIAGFD